MCDVFYPRIWRRRAQPVPVGTVSMTVYFLATAADLAEAGTGFVLGQAHAHAFHAGYFDQSARMWSEAGRLDALYREELLPQARAALAAAEAAYGTGEVDFMTLLDAQMTLNRLRQDRFRFTAARRIALAELEELTGTALAPRPAEEE